MIETVAATPALLVACDFDGTLAPIVDDPDDAVALPRSVHALHRLAGLPRTWVAIVSGRRRIELVERFGDDDFTLVGEHGSDWGEAAPTDSPAMARARRQVEQAVVATAGSTFEHKARSVTFHFRNAPEPGPALDRLRDWVAGESELHLLEGKSVLEFSVAETHKGHAISTLRHRLGIDAVIFIGDDTTDESVFEALEPADLGVKVGPGATAASRRLADPADVTALLEHIADLREKT
ncbi:MAG: trehalose-phosphatase [Acidimicrobiia bacterium]